MRPQNLPARRPRPVAHHSARDAEQRRDLAPADSERPRRVPLAPRAYTCECRRELRLLLRHDRIAVRVDLAVVLGLPSDPQQRDHPSAACAHQQTHQVGLFESQME
jgi:hypothetical protein